jgi:DNA-binding NarL/FixJ family response regulator
LGIEARARALLSEGAAAELLYREAIERLGRTRLRVDLGRAHLLYGELLATGERVRKRTVETRDELTAQEAQVARLAHGGLSNAEIGARLFISQHAVAYHLRKISPKLGITSRSELGRAQPDSSNATGAA